MGRRCGGAEDGSESERVEFGGGAAYSGERVGRQTKVFCGVDGACGNLAVLQPPSL